MKWENWKLENNWKSFNRWWIISVVLSFIYILFFGVVEWTFLGIVEILGALTVAWFFLLGIYIGLVKVIKTFISENYAGRIMMIVIALLWFIANYNEMKIDFGW